MTDVPALLPVLQEVERHYRALLLARMRLDNQIGALERRQGRERQVPDAGDGHQRLALDPVAALQDPAVHLRMAREQIKAPLARVKRVQEGLAAELPIAAWVRDQRGLGLAGVAQIIGEAGDLAAYPAPEHLWKRMGIGLVDGARQRRVRDKELAVRHGYDNTRRMVLWAVGFSAMMQGPYLEVYRARRTVEDERHPDFSALHRHRRAKRFMEKRLLRDLRAAWIRAC